MFTFQLRIGGNLFDHRLLNLFCAFSDAPICNLWRAGGITQDFFAEFEMKVEFNLLLPSNIQQFTESTTDRMSGVVFRFALQVPRKPNKCALPL